MLRRLPACLLLSLAWSNPGQAEVRIGGGIAEEIDGEEATVATLAWLSEQRHPWEVLGGYVWPRRGDVYVPNAVFAGISKRVVWRRWFVSGGVAWVSVDNDVLSGHRQFLTGVGYDFGRGAVLVRHLSNGGSDGRNRGETFLLVEIRL